MEVAFSVGKQDTHGVIDPGLATPSTLHIDVGDLVVATDNAKQHQEQHIDRYLADTGPEAQRRKAGSISPWMRPCEGWKSATQINGGAAMAIGRADHACGRPGRRREPRPRRRVAGRLSGLFGALPPTS